MTQHGKPWFVHCSIEFLEHRIQPSWLCFEWGAGGSTVWLAELAAHVVAVEHDPEWQQQTQNWLQSAGVSDKAEVVLRDLNFGYAEYINHFDNGYFDLVSIDGRRRADCTRAAISKIKPGGILVIDNSERAGYQASIDEVGIRQWERCEFYSGNSEGWTTSVYFKPKV